MKKLFINTALVLISLHLFAQAQTFDIASFVAPAGWQRLDSNGVVGFFDTKTNNGITTFCQILLYPSHASSGNAAKDFNSEWAKRVVKKTGTKNKPTVLTQKTPDGWTVVRGYSNITQKQMAYTIMLISMSGFGKQMSALVNIAGENYKTDVTAFFEKFQLSSGGAVQNNSNNTQSNLTGSASLANYVYTAPPGWTTTNYPDGIVLTSPVSNTGEKCNLTLWSMRQPGSSLQNDSEKIFAEVFSSFDLKNSSTPPYLTRGTSSQGWDYFITRKSIALRGGDFQTMFGFVFVAKLRDQLAVISGISKDPLVSSCFGLQLNDVWPQFFYSLQFRNWNSTKENSLAKMLPAVWITATATASDRFAFAPNGRFAGAAASQRYASVSSTEMLRITDAYFGNGAYVLNGNAIQLIYDSEKNNPESGMLRVEQESRDGGRTWTNKLYLSRKSVVDGSLYEVYYDKQ
ncbi:MAG: hypothetical protein ACJ75F_08660 [Flavisolibacter sp.]